MVLRLLRRPLGRRYAHRRDDGIQGRRLVGHQWKPADRARSHDERFRRPNFGTIEIEQTIDDPKAYTRPFTTRLRWQLMPDTEIMEMICLENNQSIHHLVGADGPKPTPPK